MTTPDSIAQLCEVCSTLDIQRMTHPPYPCCKPLPCSTPPINEFGTYVALGSIDQIKRRRSTCDLCGLIAEKLDKEPTDLEGECRITESGAFCTFTMPTDVKARDPTVTHFHLTQAAVIFDPTENQTEGPPLPWEVKARGTYGGHYVLNLQVSRNQDLTKLLTNLDQAKSHVEASGPTDSLQTEEEYLNIIGGRSVGAQVNIELIRAWLHQCECEHGEICMPSFKLPADRDVEPTFIVDVIESCLADTPLQCRYVALSYVWGTASVFKHVTENSQDLRKPGSLRSLPIPATIRDAITLVRAIGERYLWVDSLCIIQNDLKMQQVEIVRMASIYSKALFTIIAAAGDHADSGLPGVEPGSRERVQKILKLTDSELLTVIDVRNTQSGIDDTTWAQRAWTFQERMLSNRVLVFSETQAYWSCRTTSYSEECALEHIRDVDRLHVPFPERQVCNFLHCKPLELSEYRNAYFDLLSAYRLRRLTYDTDLLNAFRGISEILGALQKDTFFWGLPGSLFTYALTWFFTGHSARNHVQVPVLDGVGAIHTIPFPSWSWAAWSGDDPLDLPWLHGGDGYGVRPVTDFYIVDVDRHIIPIHEQLWEEDHLDDPVRALWLPPEQAHRPPPPDTEQPPCRVGQLCFWASFANVSAVRHWYREGRRYVSYVPLPKPGGGVWLEPDLESVQQDFIVIARGTLTRKLVLLAIEWQDGVAYRVSEAQVDEADWIQVENKTWRWIVLG